VADRKRADTFKASLKAIRGSDFLRKQVSGAAGAVPNTLYKGLKVPGSVSTQSSLASIDIVYKPAGKSTTYRSHCLHFSRRPTQNATAIAHNSASVERSGFWREWPQANLGIFMSILVKAPHEGDGNTQYRVRRYIRAINYEQTVCTVSRTPLS